MGWDRGWVDGGSGRTAHIAFCRTSDRCYTALCATPEEAARFSNRTCTCGAEPLSAMIQVRAYGGNSWIGTACWTCMCIVDGAAMPGGSSD